MRIYRAKNILPYKPGKFSQIFFFLIREKRNGTEIFQAILSFAEEKILDP